MTTLTTSIPREIKFDRITGDYCATVDGNPIGYFPSYHAAEIACDEHIYDLLSRGLIGPSDAGSFCPGCGDALDEPPLTDIAQADSWRDWTIRIRRERHAGEAQPRYVAHWSPPGQIPNRCDWDDEYIAGCWQATPAMAVSYAKSRIDAIAGNLGRKRRWNIST